jgi:hypothetical protein
MSPFCFWSIPRENENYEEGKKDESKNVFAQLPGTVTKNKNLFIIFALLYRIGTFPPVLILFFQSTIGL